MSKNILCFLFYGDAQAPSIFCAFFCPEVDFAGSFGTWERPVTVETVEIKHRLYLFIQELKLPIDRNNISIPKNLFPQWHHLAPSCPLYFGTTHADHFPATVLYFSLYVTSTHFPDCVINPICRFRCFFQAGLLFVIR